MTAHSGPRAQPGTHPERDAFLRHVAAHADGKRFNPAHSSRIEVDRLGACRFLVRFYRGEALRVEISIEAATPAQSKAVFDRLKTAHDTIEQAPGTFVWERKDNNLRSTIHTPYPRHLDLRDDASCQAAARWTIGEINRLRDAVCIVLDNAG